MFWLPILTSFLSLIFLANIKTAIATSPTFGPNILVSDAISQSTSSGDGPPILDVDIAGGVYVAWIDHRNFQTEVFFSKLTGAGNAFSSNKPLSGISDQKSFPQIEEDAGNIYIAWNERRIVNNQVQQGVFFTKSTDGGQTFTEEVFIDSSDELPINMIAHDNKLFIAYSQTSKEIWMARSTDAGTNFVKTRVSAFDNVTRQRPAVDFIGNNVFAFWLEANQVFFTKSSDGGATFESSISVFSHPNAAIHLLGNTFGRLSTKVDGENIFLAFDFFLQTANPFTTDREVYFTKSTNGGNTFSAAQRLSSDNPNSHTIQQNPSLTLLPDGSPVVAWYDERDGADFRKTMLVYSQDQGENFSPDIRIDNTSGFGVFSGPTIVADREGKIHFVRMDGSFSPPGVYYTKIDLGLQFDIPPTPFLDLPWDYQSKGLSFSEAALAINSFFDHEYPLLSIGLSEPLDIVNFRGLPRKKLPYSSHDGYDYGKDAEALIGDPVLASAGGCASYFKDGATGNAIKIDHGNGYQTRYYHLSDNDLVTKSATCTNVAKGQQIGRIGATGNIIPPGDLGAHIHFMVVEDKNKDGNFDDNIPDGITDPFGWQSTESDPWPNFNFSSDGQDRTGNISYYLWTKPIANLSGQLTSNGGFFELERYKVEFPQNATNQNLNIEMEAAPIAKPSNFLESLGSTIIVTAKDTLGNLVRSFLGFFIVTIEFDGFDLTGYNTQTISIYSSEDGINWIKEDTTVNFSEKAASAEINHLSYFALMAERLDTTAPTTVAILSGSQGQTNLFRSDVQVNLDAQDNSGGLGIDYTLYRIGDGDWQQYFNPLGFTDEGSYNIEFYSVDKDENIEEIKNVTFTIDKTAPEAQIAFNPDSQKIEVIGIDNSGQEVDINTTSSYKLNDLAGNTLLIETDDKSDREIEIEKLIYNQTSFRQPENSLEVNFKKKKGKIDKIIQTLKLGDLTIKISYDKKNDQSLIETRQGKKKPVKEPKPGIVILKLITDQGKLEHNY